MALASCLGAAAALAGSAVEPDTKGQAAVRLAFKIVIPSSVVVDKDGTARSNDRQRLKPVTTIPKLLRTDPHAVVALP